MQSKPALIFLLSAMVRAVLIPLRAGAGDSGVTVIVGAWTAEALDVRGRAAAADVQTVTLEADGPRQSLRFVYDRAHGVLIHTLSRERSTAGTNMFTVREMQWAG